MLDEADKMIDMGLEEDVNKILNSIPRSLDKSDKEKEVAVQEE